MEVCTYCDRNTVSHTADCPYREPMPYNETPATSWAVWAWQAYRDGRLVEVDPNVDAELAKAYRDLASSQEPLGIDLGDVSDLYEE